MDVSIKKFDVGNLARLIFVDDRMQERSAPVAADSPLIGDSTRTILGVAQMNWLFQNLDTTSNVWNIVPSSLMKTSAVNVLGQPILWYSKYER